MVTPNGVLKMNILGSFPYFSEESLDSIVNNVRAMLRSGRLTEGPHLEEFEQQFAHYNNIKYAVAVSSGTAALDVALRYYKLQGREVIVPTNTFVSTPNAVIFAGGKPVFADMNPDTLGIDVEDVKKKVTPKTAGVIVVHIAGLVCPQINELKEFCQQKGLFLLEDSAHAHGAMMNGRKAGTFGDVGCFSFYPTKIMTSCEGGMVVTNNEKLADEVRCMRTCGQNRDRLMVMLGHNWRMSELAAIVGKQQLTHLDEFISKRNHVARQYEDVLSDTSGFTLFRALPNFRHSYYKYPLKLDEGIDRLKIAALMKEKFGIETGHVYYPPCHLHPYYRETFGTKEGDLPNAERGLKQILCLPMHVALTDDNVKYIGESLCLSINAVSTALQ
ncbi:MAG TPA: DegT/DnrJ/EryC1/StrS family aminotransferase [Candidatus Acidoferrales bacterium]|nr:DegT/DnrJ/EryC1/StrS family aminotransferase [Candidatus Acidoferrales bacterium]